MCACVHYLFNVFLFVSLLLPLGEIKDEYIATEQLDLFPVQNCYTGIYFTSTLHVALSPAIIRI